jgi:hypothetical protein
LTIDHWRTIDLILNILGNTFTICSAGLAIFIYWTNRERVSEAVNLLLNYSTYTSLVDLRLILQRLNDLRYSAEADKTEILNILGEIEGHIAGDNTLNANPSLIEIRKKIQAILKRPDRFNEPSKRSLAGELRGVIQNLQVELKVK